MLHPDKLEHAVYHRLGYLGARPEAETPQIEQWSGGRVKHSTAFLVYLIRPYEVVHEDFIYGFEKFREAGKSIILSHDLVQDASIDIGGKNKIDGRYPENYEETKADILCPRLYISGENEPYYLGLHVNNAYYFYYEREAVTTLNREFLHTIKTKADAYVIYADLCTLSEEELERYHITFKKIPRDITKL